MPETTVINIKNAPADWKTNPRYKYIGRANKRLGLAASKLANPYKMERESQRSEVIGSYRQWLWAQLEMGKIEKEDLYAWGEDRNLICFCAPKACHGDEIVRALRMLRQADKLALGIKHLSVLLHALGQSSTNPLGWRDYYCVCVEGDDATLCKALVEHGLMKEGRTINDGQDRYYIVTEAGREFCGVAAKEAS